MGLLLVVPVLGIGPARVLGAEVSTTFIAVADAQVTESAPTVNHATAALRADGGVDPDVESYLRFTVSGIQDPIVDATLRLYASTGTVDGPAVYNTSPTWTETAITWNNRPARIGGPVDDVAGIPTAAWVDYDVTGLVTGNGTVAVGLVTVSNDGVDFHSREGAQKPQLVVRSSSTPPDTVSPGPPTNLTASATSATEVVMSWTAATDDTGVTGYEIQRDGAVLATIAPATTYTDGTTWASSTFSYRIRARDAAGNWSPLSAAATVTTPGGGGDPTFVAAGDIATCGQPGHAATAALLDTIPGVVAALGDLAYPSGTADQFRDCYGPTWGRHLARTKPAPGNHEYLTAGATPYYDYFGAAAGDRTKGYYSYDVGTWHVVVLNSNCAAISGCETGSPQEQWLRADLAAHPASCTLAYWHHPLFSTGYHGGQAFMQPIWQALYDGGAELVLSGHEHTYERFAPQTPAGVADSAFGIRQFVVGTGGRDSHRTLPTGGGNSETRDAVTFGVLRMELRPSGYTWAFVPEAGGTFTDTGVGSCHAAPAPADTTPPVTTITSGPAEGSTVASATASFAFVANESPVSFTCSIDGAAPAAATSPKTYTALADGPHTFAVRATDTAGNIGLQATRTWTVAEPPSPPGGLIATAPSPTQVDLAWTAATDNVGIANYLVYRNGDPTPIATLGNVTAYSDATVVASTPYSYAIRARDPAGNLSAPSATATVTTPAGPPPPPPPPPPPSTTLTFAPTADARVEEAAPSINYGTAPYLRTDGATDPDVESYLRFTVSGVSGAVQSAKLRVYAFNGSVDGPAAYRTTSGWTETGLTWANRPARTGGALADRGAIAVNSWVEYDLTAVVTGNATYELVLATTSSDGVDMRSREYATVAERPQLVVTYTP